MVNTIDVLMLEFKSNFHRKMYNLFKFLKLKKISKKFVDIETIETFRVGANSGNWINESNEKDKLVNFKIIEKE